MASSRKLTVALAVLLAAMAVFSFWSGYAGPGAALRFNPDTGAVQAAAAILGLAAAAMGARACNVYLVSLGLLFCTDAFMGFTRGLFYLSFEAMRGDVQPMARPDRYIASLPYLAVGAVALIAGFVNANREAQERNNVAPPT